VTFLPSAEKPHPCCKQVGRLLGLPSPTNNGIYGVSIPLSQQAATNLTTSKTITVQIPKPDERNDQPVIKPARVASVLAMITGCIPGCNIARLFNLAAISSLLITGKDVGITFSGLDNVEGGNSFFSSTDSSFTLIISLSVSIPLSQQAATNLTTSKTITVQIPKPDERNDQPVIKQEPSSPVENLNSNSNHSSITSNDPSPDLSGSDSGSNEREKKTLVKIIPESLLAYPEQQE
jgi:hypothetical protein